jgi:hypothetical protein
MLVRHSAWCRTSVSLPSVLRPALNIWVWDTTRALMCSPVCCLLRRKHARSVSFVCRGEWSFTEDSVAVITPFVHARIQNNPMPRDKTHTCTSDWYSYHPLSLHGHLHLQCQQFWQRQINSPMTDVLQTQMVVPFYWLRSLRWAKFIITTEIHIFILNCFSLCADI